MKEASFLPPALYRDSFEDLDFEFRLLSLLLKPPAPLVERFDFFDRLDLMDLADVLRLNGVVLLWSYVFTPRVSRIWSASYSEIEPSS